MGVPGWQEAGDVALADVIEMRVAALQDERYVWIEAIAGRFHAGLLRERLDLDGCIFGFFKLGFQRLNACFIAGLHCPQFSA